MKRYFLLWTLLFGLFHAYGQDGSLDPSFDGKGWTNLFYLNEKDNYGYENGTKTFAQSDGKYLVVFAKNGSPIITRYNANGTLDKSFGINGFSMIVNGFFSIDAARQSDGKIVVAGVTYSGAGYDFSLLRYNPDGTMDNTFGTDGTSASIDFFGNDDYPFSVAIQTDGKIVVAGYTWNPTDNNSDFAVARFTADGSADTEFGSNADGKVTTGIDQNDLVNSYDEAHSVAIQDDGKIVVAGYFNSYSTNWNSQIAIVRYNSNGSLDAGNGGSDPGFGTGGMVITGLSDANVYGKSVAIQGDGKIVVAGHLHTYDYQTNESTYSFILSRYTITGNLDVDFSGDGMAMSEFGSAEAYVNSMAIQGDGKIVVAGNAYSSTTGYDFVVARYNSDGTQDISFDSDGMLTNDLNSNYDIPASVTVLTDGKIIVTGSADYITPDGNSNSDYALSRYTATGTLDNTFNGTGILIGYHTSGTSSDIHATATQNDGKIVAAGVGFNTETNTYDVALVRYHPNGTLDYTFGIDGTGSTSFGPNSIFIVSVAIQTDGKIMLGANYINDNNNMDFAFTRFTATGVLDNTFGTDGKVITDFGNSDVLKSMTFQNDGKLLAVGDIENSDFTIVRYTNSGAMDATFGTSGKLTIDFFGGSDYANAVAVQNDGKIVVAGTARNPNNTDFALARFTTAGRFDNTFGNRGKVTSDMFGGDDNIFDMTIQSDGKIVVAGNTININTNIFDFAVARYNSNGTLDGTFDSDGMTTTEFGSYAEIGSLALQSDGKIVVGGFVYYSSGSFFTIARYTTTGALDNTFDEDGMITPAFSNTGLYSLAWNNGRIYTWGGEYFIYPSPGILVAYKAGTAAASVPEITINDVTVYKSYTDASNATLTISATGTITSPITVNYVTQDSTASSKGRYPEYAATKGSVILTSTSQTADINIPINTNVGAGYPKYFKVNLSLSQQMKKLATIGDQMGVVTINEPMPSITAVTQINKELVKDKLSVKTYPNPSSGSFTFQLQSSNNTPVTINVMDASGKLVERKTGVVANGSLQLGTTYRQGVYYAEIIQGTEKVSIKLVKQ